MSIEQKKNQINEFLTRHGMHAECFRMQEELDTLLGAMRAGLLGEACSLPMQPTYLSGEMNPENVRCIALDAGGTNFRVSLVSFDKHGTATVEYLKKMPMPGTRGRLTREEFFDQIADAVLPVADKSDRIGFCFSFPTEILPDREGRLIAFCKEVLVDGAENALIGQSLNDALIKKGCAPKRITILNDTVAALLSGLTAGSFDGYIGFILGTGTNCCYLDDAANIKKIPPRSGKMIVNCESGMYAGFSRGDYDRELDEESEMPGDHMAEKMLSGVYLGKVIHRTTRGACEEGLFSDTFRTRLSAFDSFSLIDISAYCNSVPGNPISALTEGNEDDELMLRAIVDNAFERAARIVAVTLVAVMLHADSGKSPDHPCAVTAEGSTFYQAPLFLPKLEKYRREWLGDVHGRYFEILRMEDATILGAATAAVQT